MDKSDKYPFISVVIPVKNAERFLTQCLKSLNNLNYPKDKYEVIISDSSSKDKTREIAAQMGAKIVDASGESVCAGRNSGFKIAKGEIIAFSDADCIMDREWLKNCVRYFQDERVACVGGPSLVPSDESWFGKACGLVFSYSIFTGGSSYGRDFNAVKEVKGNPGCNAIYRRNALDKVMPVEEEIVEAEDAFMNQKLMDLGYKFLYTPDTKLWHYRSSNLKRFWRQNFRYAIGRVIIGRRDRRLINPLHYIAGFSLPAILALMLIALFAPLVFFKTFLFLALGFLILLFIFGWVKTKSHKIAINVPLAVIILLIAWSLGFMKEFFNPKVRGGRK